jgi:hypothetical protein
MKDPNSKSLVREVILSTGLFLLAFLATAELLHTTIRSPLDLHADERSEKLEMIRQWHDKIFSAAFGSSHVHNGFSAKVFDAQLQGTPLATHTANLAIEGGSQTEQRVLALRFVGQLPINAPTDTPPQPCLVMLELGAGANFTNDHLIHPRAINIYDWQSLSFVRQLTDVSMPRVKRYGRIGYAVTASGLYYLNVGMLSNKIFAPPLSNSVLDDQTREDRRGQLRLPDAPEATSHIAQILAARPRDLPSTPGILVAGNSNLIAQLTEASPLKGVSFVYFEMPKVGDVNGATDFPDHISVPTKDGTKQVPIINLARPDRFPQLYNPVLWHDDSHLNGRGSEVLSALLAQQLKLWYASHGLPLHCGG